MKYKNKVHVPGTKTSFTLVIDTTDTDPSYVYALAAQKSVEHFRMVLNKLPISPQYRKEIWRTLHNQTVTPQDLAKCLAQAIATTPIE
jgi:hypothetical protein